MYDASMGEVDANGMANNGMVDPDLNPLDANNDDMMPDGDDRMANGTMADPDLNPLDSNNDDLLPDSDDPSRGTTLDPKAQ